MRYVSDCSETFDNFKIPYFTRFAISKRRQMLNKLYRLQDYLGSKLSPVDVTMVTFTIQHRKDYSDFLDSADSLYSAYHKMKDVMRKRYGQTDYFTVLEPHKDGYIHIHSLWFGDISLHEQSHLKDIWADKYGMTDYKDVGITFSRTKGTHDTNEGKLRHVVNYLSKYMGKSFESESFVSDSDDGYIGSKEYSHVSQWSVKEWIFYSYLWLRGRRSWNSSRKLSRVMSKSESEKEKNGECIRVSYDKNRRLQGGVYTEPEETVLLYDKGVSYASTKRGKKCSCYFLNFGNAPPPIHNPGCTCGECSNNSHGMSSRSFRDMVHRKRSGVVFPKIFGENGLLPADHPLKSMLLLE